MGQIVTNKIKQSITELIGHTPLIALNQYVKKQQLETEFIVKLAYFNPANSVKDRVAKAMIEDAEARDVLTKDKTIMETTSGNTGIGLAAIAAAKGYKLRIYMQEGVSEERTKVVKVYGTEVVPFSDVPEMVAAFEETDGDFVETIKVFRETVVEQEENVVFLNQLDIDEVLEVETAQVYEVACAVAKSDGILSRYFNRCCFICRHSLQNVQKTKGNELSLSYPILAYDIYLQIYCRNKRIEEYAVA